jgi:hypothetical protein
MRNCMAIQEPNDTPAIQQARERDNGGPVRRTRPGRRGRRVVQKELPFACLRRTSRHVRRLHSGERRGARPSQHIQSSGFAFVALACMSSAPGRTRGWLRHPMLVAVKSGRSRIFSPMETRRHVALRIVSRLAVFDRIAVKRRGDIGAPRIASFTRADGIALGVGTLANVATLFLHPVLIGAP